jgi:predicted N-acetyltransferase YhbS
MIFEKLERRHDRQRFDCGVESVNRYLRESARQHASKDLSLTFVLVEEPGDAQILGFFTLLMSSVETEIIPQKGLPPGGTYPVVLLAQFGVDTRFQGRGLGRDLLYEALWRSLQAAEHVGCAAVVLDAIDEKALAFYTALGFHALSDDPRHVWMPMSTIRERSAIGKKP